MKYHFTRITKSTRIAEKKPANLGRDMKKLEPSYTVSGNKVAKSFRKVGNSSKY